MGTELAPHQMFEKDLKLYEGNISSALPANVPANKFISTAVVAVQLNPDILDCEKQSIINSCMRAAADGLILDGREAALVKFGNEATYMPMTQGIIKKVRNSGELSTLSAHVVKENDEFSYELGDEEKIVHRPALKDRGAPIGAYAIAKLRDGGIAREWMTIEEIEEVRAVSRAKNGGPWKQWWGEMARKTVIRRLSKRLPMSSELDRVITAVDDDYDFSAQSDPEPTGPKKTRAAAAVAAAAAQAEEPTPEAEFEEVEHGQGDLI